MPTVALTNIADGADIDAAPHRNNYAAIQAAVNGLDGDNFAAGALAATAVVKARVTGDAASRLVVQADGKLVWGDGAGAGDVNLYRSGANTLKSDDSLEVTGSVFFGANNGNVSIGASADDAGGIVVVAIKNRVTAPAATPASGGVLYVEAGALKFKGSSGTVTAVAPA